MHTAWLVISHFVGIFYALLIFWSLVELYCNCYYAISARLAERNNRKWLT